MEWELTAETCARNDWESLDLGLLNTLEYIDVIYGNNKKNNYIISFLTSSQIYY